MDDKMLDMVELGDLPEPYDQIAELIGLEATKKLAKEFGGEMVYLPKIDTMLQSVRDKLIRDEFNGYNYEELSKKYNLTTKWIRHIVSSIEDEIKKKPMDGQIRLEL